MLVRALFLLSPGDEDEARAVVAAEAAGLAARAWWADWPAGAADYARKTNLGYRVTDEPWLFTAADDLCFCPGWADEALQMARRTGARVVGTNDLGNERVTSGRHSTHSLFHRSYVDELGTVDGSGAVLCEEYDHQFVDDEAVGTARWRREYAYAPRAMVEHLHPHWGKADDDPTYRKGQRAFDRDRLLHDQRAHLWGSSRSRGLRSLEAPRRRPSG